MIRNHFLILSARYGLVAALFVVVISPSLAQDEFFMEIFKPREDTRMVSTGPSYADYVLVKKSERKLYLYANNKKIKSYKIALGRQPTGHKQKEGDSRTPEGTYILDWRNPNSRFYRSIHVSYPTIQQTRSAEEAGVSPGGAIMIHGQPNEWGERIRLTFDKKDWTEGCIAVENQDMLEIWDLVKDGTPITIEP